MPLLQLEGYIEPAEQSGKWRTTEAGTIVTGAKPPRFTKVAVDAALADLRNRILTVN